MVDGVWVGSVWCGVVDRGVVIGRGEVVWRQGVSWRKAATGGLVGTCEQSVSCG